MLYKFYHFSTTGKPTADLCDNSHYPKGLFFSLLVDINPFQDIPVLKEIIDLSGRLDAYVTSFPSTEVTSNTKIDILQDIVDAKGITERLLNLTVHTAGLYAELMVNQSLLYLSAVQQTLVDINKTLDDFITSIKSNSNIVEQFLNTVSRISDIFENGLKRLKLNTENLVESVNSNNRLTKARFVNLYNDEVNRIISSIDTAKDKVVNQAKSVIKSVNGFGIRGVGSLNLFHIKLLQIDLEIVYSADQLGACGKYNRAYDLLEGENAIRIYASSSTDIFVLCPFIKIKPRGRGIGIAVSLQTPENIVASVFAEMTILGAQINVDVLINPRGLYVYTTGRIGSVFKAELDIFAEVGLPWDQKTFEVRGQFLADADRNGDFGDSYLTALRQFTQRISDEAQKRISQVQDAFTNAQGGLTAAQNWLEEKKSVVLSANSDFDNAVSKMEDVKIALEKAKIPFQSAINTLNEAQRKVDNLCRIKTCRPVCVPGVSCDICWKKVWFVSVPYPCCHSTNCMFTLPDLVCEGINLGCQALRVVAYAALEAAKFFIKAPMLALDIAKGAVSVAQVIVDKSRVVLDIAVGAMDLAKIGLEGTKIAFQMAKQALEGVKQVVKLGLKAFDFVVQYGIQSILDVKNCGFEVQLTGRDETVFNVYCEVNAFKQGFRKIEFRINFSDVVQSIWNAAKATIESILHSIGDFISGRRRREIKYDTLSALHRFVRETRHADIDDSEFETFANQTLYVVLNTTGFRTNVDSNDFDNRREIFEEKCNIFEATFGFLKNASLLLFEMTNETAYVLGNAMDTVGKFDQINVEDAYSNITIETIEIDLDVALSDFNLSTDDVMETLQSAKEDALSNSLISQITATTKEAGSLLKNQTENANKIMIVNQWISAMNNISGVFFTEDTCVSFLDCAHYSVSRLYDLFVGINIKNTDFSLNSISEFENAFLELTGNVSHTIQDTFKLSVELSEQLDLLQSFNVFCSKPPGAMSPLKNQTVMRGGTLQLTCNASGEPSPDIWWFKDAAVLVQHTGSVLTIKNVTKHDAGQYHCVAGNIVANFTFEEAHIFVQG